MLYVSWFLHVSSQSVSEAPKSNPTPHRCVALAPVLGPLRSRRVLGVRLSGRLGLQALVLLLEGLGLCLARRDVTGADGSPFTPWGHMQQKHSIGLRGLRLPFKNARG